MSDDEPQVWPVAYCAPGGRFDAAFTLMVRNELVTAIEEHPWLEGTGNILLVNPDAFTLDF